MKRSLKWLKSFFVTYFWLGVVLILVAIILSEKYKNCDFETSIIIKLLESVGIAILVASIFSFAAGTTQFIDKIREILKDIVVSRNFLSNIDAEGKREALNSLLKPSRKQSNIYSNIEDYYNTYINETLNISKKNVRSNYNILVRIYFDNETNKVIAEGHYSYRLYPSSDGYDKITAAFYERDSDSLIKSIMINSPNGDRKVFENPEMESGEFGGDKIKKVEIELSKLDHYKEQDHLDIELVLIESGSDHWGMFEFQALQPTDGFRCYIRCADGIVLRKYSVFVIGAKYHIDHPDNQNITISCNQWINEGSGLVALVGTDQN